MCCINVTRFHRITKWCWLVAVSPVPPWILCSWCQDQMFFFLLLVSVRQHEPQQIERRRVCVCVWMWRSEKRNRSKDMQNRLYGPVCWLNRTEYVFIASSVHISNTTETASPCIMYWKRKALHFIFMLATTKNTTALRTLENLFRIQPIRERATIATTVSQRQRRTAQKCVFVLNVKRFT